MNQRKTALKTCIIGAEASAKRSGLRSTATLGTCSPKTTCSAVTTVSEMINGSPGMMACRKVSCGGQSAARGSRGPARPRKRFRPPRPAPG